MKAHSIAARSPPYIKGSMIAEVVEWPPPLMAQMRISFTLLCGNEVESERRQTQIELEETQIIPK